MVETGRRYEEDEVPLAVHFLRFLRSPHQFKRAYLSSISPRTYGRELREGYFEGDAGLHALFVLGRESITSTALRHRVPERASEYLRDLDVILFLVTEDGGGIRIKSLELNLEGGSPEAAIWAQLEHAAARLLDSLGEAQQPPRESFDEMADRCCWVIPPDQRFRRPE
jgi:hypothetical protein